MTSLDREIRELTVLLQARQSRDDHDWQQAVIVTMAVLHQALVHGQETQALVDEIRTRQRWGQIDEPFVVRNAEWETRIQRLSSLPSDLSERLEVLMAQRLLGPLVTRERHLRRHFFPLGPDRHDATLVREALPALSKTGPSDREYDWGFLRLLQAAAQMAIIRHNAQLTLELLDDAVQRLERRHSPNLTLQMLQNTADSFLESGSARRVLLDRVFWQATPRDGPLPGEQLQNITITGLQLRVNNLLHDIVERDFTYALRAVNEFRPRALDETLLHNVLKTLDLSLEPNLYVGTSQRNVPESVMPKTENEDDRAFIGRSLLLDEDE